MVKLLVMAAVVATLAVSAPAGDARSPAGMDAVDAEMLRATAVPRSDGQRAVIVELRADERITAAARVIRYQTVVARSRLFRLRPGRWILYVPLPGPSPRAGGRGCSAHGSARQY